MKAEQIQLCGKLTCRAYLTYRINAVVHMDTDDMILLVSMSVAIAAALLMVFCIPGFSVIQTAAFTLVGFSSLWVLWKQKGGVDAKA